MNKVVKTTSSGIKYVVSDVVKSLDYNNTFLPNVNRVIFNLKTEKNEPVIGADGKPTGERKKTPLEQPVFATTLYFDDGTCVTVKNSGTDPITLVNEKLSDGSTVMTASRRDKELAIVHAIVKRLVGVEVVDENGRPTGKINGNGYGNVLTELVDSGFDQVVADAQAKIDRAARKKAYEERQAEHEAKKAAQSKKYTFADIAQLLGPILEKAANDPALVERLVKAVEG